MASFSRFYRLGLVPHGMTWDEAAIGYNGHAVFTTRRDEWLTRLPISFRSFGDYKAPFAIYLNGVSTFLLGMNLWAVRFPFAAAAIVSVILIVFVAYQLFLDFDKRKAAELSLLTAFLMAVSPWHLHYSRVAFESGMSLSFVLAGVVLFLYYRRSISGKLKTHWQLLILLLSTSSFVLSLYTYHSAKIVTPVLAMLLVILYFKDFRKKVWQLSLAGVWAFLLLWPMIKDSLTAKGAERLGQASILTAEISSYEKLILFVENYFAHLKPSFLVFGQSDTLRHGDGSWGVLFSSTLILIVISLASLFLSKKYQKKRKFFFFALAWVLIGIVPAAMGRSVPHSNRALLSLPGLMILAVMGYSVMKDYVLSKYGKLRATHGEKFIEKTILGTLVLVQLAFFISYTTNYYTDYAAASVEAFPDGYLEAFAFVKDYEKGENGKPQVSKIKFTDCYGQPYIYALFVRETNPIWYQGGSLNTYEFSSVDQGDLSRQNTVVVAAGAEDTPVSEADKLIIGADGSVRFKIYYLE